MAPPDSGAEPEPVAPNCRSVVSEFGVELYMAVADGRDAVVAVRDRRAVAVEPDDGHAVPGFAFDRRVEFGAGE